MLFYKNQHSENKQKIVSFFQDILEQIEAQLKKLVNKTEIKDKIFQIIYLFCQTIFRFHLDVQQHQITYSVIPVLEIGYQGMKNPDKSKIDILLKEIQNFFKDQKELNTQNKKYYHCTLLITAYYNIQQQKYKQSLEILEQLQDYYGSFDKEIIQKKQKQENQQLTQKGDQIFREGFYESIITFKALNYVFKNQINKLQLEIKKLENLYSQEKHEEHKERFNQRLNQHIKLFKTHQFFMQKQFEDAKNTLITLKFVEIEEALLLFFNNQNIQCIRNLETIYYNLFSDQFFQIFTYLQELERKKITNKDIEEIFKIYQSTKNQNLSYQYGRGIILLFMVICSRLLRIAKKYKESQNMMVKMFQICQRSQTEFQDSLLIFFKYDLLLSYLYEKVETKKEDMFMNAKKREETKLSQIHLAEKDGEKFILKTINLQNELNSMSKFDILNEITIQMLVSHRNIQKVYDLYQNKQGNIVLVQKLQGENLRKFLKENDSSIDQIQRYGYILQIITVFQYLHNLNIIHCDLKQENILVQLSNNKKIKLIDFGFSQIKLFNKYFKPIGTTFYLAPSELKKNNQLCTFESDIFMIAQTVIEILKLNNDLENSDYLISEWIKQLLRNMTKKEVEKRSLMSDVLQEFKLDFFILKIFHEFSCQLNQQEKQKQYCEFSKWMLELFDKFISDKYMYSLSPNQPQSEKNFTIFREDIWKNIKCLMEKDDEDFITCLQDNDIKLFCESFASKNTDLEMIDFEQRIQNITKQQKQEDSNSKNDILSEYQIDIIDKKNYEINKNNEGQDKTQLSHIQKEMYNQMDNIIQELKSQFQIQPQPNANNAQQYDQQDYQVPEQYSEYQIKLLDMGNLSAQVSIQQLSQLSNQSYPLNTLNSYFQQSNKSYNNYLQQDQKISQVSKNDMQSYMLIEYNQNSSQNINSQIDEQESQNSQTDEQESQNSQNEWS
ncbi:hypothetical protein ABPG73_001529 [Tetrahymena malaccensis]